MNDNIISNDTILLISIAITTGVFARLITLKQDYRQYPSYPNGYFTQLVLGFIAASIGAVAIPALISKNYTAITFLTVAIQQFRDVRRSERDSLKSLENTEFTYRGDAYIDGIAKTFESRNFIVLTVSFITGLCVQLTTMYSVTIQIIVGLIIGISLAFLLHFFTKGKTIEDIADVEVGSIKVIDSELYVNDIYVTNTLGTKSSREFVQSQGIAAVITPKKEHYRITLDNFGQRQAIVFEACKAIGVRRYQFTRKEYESGKIVVVLVPIIQDVHFFLQVIKETPLLENVTKSHRKIKSKNLHRKNEGE